MHTLLELAAWLASYLANIVESKAIYARGGCLYIICCCCMYTNFCIDCDTVWTACMYYISICMHGYIP